MRIITESDRKPIPKGFYILMDIEKALRKWRESGRRCSFGVYCKVLKGLGYKLI